MRDAVSASLVAIGEQRRVRLACLDLAVEMRTTNDTAAIIVDRAKEFETYVVGDGEGGTTETLRVSSDASAADGDDAKAGEPRG